MPAISWFASVRACWAIVVASTSASRTTFLAVASALCAWDEAIAFRVRKPIATPTASATTATSASVIVASSRTQNAEERAHRPSSAYA